MKRISTAILFCCLVVTATAQDGDDSKLKTFMELLRNGTEAQKDSVTKVIIEDAKANKTETDLRFYYNVLRNRKLTEEAETVQKRAIKLYPKGIMARSKEIDEFYKMENLKEKEAKYLSILKKYPVEKYPGDGIAYDYATAAITQSLIEDGQKEKALKYLDNLQEEFWRAQAYIPVAIQLLKQGDTASALPLVQKSVNDALKYIRSENQDNKAKFASVGYPGYVQIYADVLLAKGKYEEALKNVEEARSIVPDRASEFRPALAKALQMTGRDLEAFNQYTSLYKDGQFNYYEPLEKLYVKLNKGQRTGLDGFIDQLKSELNEKIKGHLSQIVIDKETPAFKLRNLNGELVDSKSLLGKVVVLDFWATWCQPCIRSFPGMQKAVTKYKDDPDVVFLFIDTWERDEDYKQKVTDFISKNNYTFNVLFDDGKTDSGVAPKFGINGIPAKFIIDKKGKTRFFLTGSSPYPDYILMEVSQMVEWARKG